MSFAQRDVGGSVEEKKMENQIIPNNQGLPYDSFGVLLSKG
jgi:hypothetical protein